MSEDFLACTVASRRFLAWLPEAVRCGDIDMPERWIPPPPPPQIEPGFAALEDRYRDLVDVIEFFATSRSWRFTAPLRSAAALARRGPRARESPAKKLGRP